MNYNISKELFEAVMDMKVEELQITTHHVAISVIVDGRYEDYEINDFFFKCIEFIQKNNINIDLNTNSDLKLDIFEFLDNWLKVNKRQ